VVAAELREQMGAIAVKAAQACGYRGAGTIEFLLAPDGSFYFLEMNTRLQVEHPVTESIYGVDLVAWQIAVADGRPLPLGQEDADARRRGHAVECRVYAEDPVRFLPAPGHITSLRVPSGPFVRDDSGVQVGSEISVFYDPLISKLVVWGEDRDQAIRRLRRALDEYHVGGTLKTNLPFHRRLVRHPAFVAGDYDTGLLAREAAAFAQPFAPEGEALEVALITAALYAEDGPRSGPAIQSAALTDPEPPSVWRLGLPHWHPQRRR
jgi:acetyl-CoA carboxylase biotin carboxylase subunit